MASFLAIVAIIVAIAAVAGAAEPKPNGLPTMAESRLPWATIAALAGKPKGRPTMAEYKARKAKEQAVVDAKAAKQAKMAAVNKVIEMLSDVQLKVVAEGKQEAKAYHRVCLLCKSKQKGKSADIKVEKNEKVAITADIAKLIQERGGLEKAIASLHTELAKAGADLKNAQRDHGAAKALFGKNKDDMKDAIKSLEMALKVMKSKKSNLMQVQSVGKTVRQAVLLADALGLGGEASQKAANLFLQEDSADVKPKVEMENFKFHSDGIIETLEKVYGNFRKQAHQVDTDEVKRVRVFKEFMQMKSDEVKQKTRLIEAVKNVAKIGKEKGLAVEKTELKTQSKLLDDDRAYLDELNTMCKEKAKTYDQRSKVRSAELVSISQALTIIKLTVASKTTANTIRFAQTAVSVRFADAVASSDDAMEAIEAEAESGEDEDDGESGDDAGAVGFLQRRAVKNHNLRDPTRDLIVSLFSARGKDLHSAALTSIAARITADPLAKIKKLITELIERSLAEASNEANQKGWCDKATSDAEQKRTYTSEDIDGLKAKMGKSEALSDKLKDEIAKLKEETSGLKENIAEAQQERSTEKRENQVAVQDAQEGMAATQQAISILDKFYKTAANQVAKAGVKDAYSGQKASSAGIIGMLQVIESDFQRTIAQTKEGDKSAEKQFYQFLTKSQMSLAEKVVVTNEKRRMKDDTDKEHDEDDDSMKTKVKVLAAANKELEQLKPACVDAKYAGSYADRNAQREQEIESLKKGLCLLSSDKTSDC